MNKSVNEGLISLLSKVMEIGGMREFLDKAANYMQSSHDGKGNEVHKIWLEDMDELSFTRSVFRTLEGRDHTMYVMDIDPYPEPDAYRLLTQLEYRNVQLVSAMRVANEVLDMDDGFFAYISGKGVYLVRKIYPNIDKKVIKKKMRKMIPFCQEEHDGEEYCENWHERTGSRPSFFRWNTVDGWKVRTGIDLSFYNRDGLQQFRVPYSVYSKFAGHLFLCAPAIMDATGKINIAKSITNTDPRYTEIRDFTVPTEHMKIENTRGVIVDPKSVKKKQKNRSEKYRKRRLNLNLPRLYEGLDDIERAMLAKMEKDLTGDVERTPPCMKNAYMLEMPDGHWNRVLLGRYLNYKGYSFRDIAMFIRFKINDEEDNSPAKKGEMERNIDLFVRPTEDNPKLVPTCLKIQEEYGNFYACRAEDAAICTRSHPLSSMKSTKAYKIRREAMRKQRLIERRISSGRSVPDMGRYNKIVNDVREMLEDNSTPTLVKKTTRAGLTTSIIIAGKKNKKRTLVLVPTNAIAKKTFPEAVEIASTIYKVDINGAVMSSNPKACLKLAIKGEQLMERKREEPEWGDRSVQFLKLPILIKPSCYDSTGKTCQFFDSTIDEGVVLDSVVTSTDGMGDGKCARISVLKNVDKYDTIFTTYAKMMAVLSSDNDEGMIMLSEFENFDYIMLDEISTLMSGQPTIIEICGERDGRIHMKSDDIRDQITKLRSNSKKSGTLVETVDRVLSYIENRIKELDIKYTRNGVKTIIVDNILDESERDNIFKHYAIMQKVVEKSNVDLTKLASFLLLMSDDFWYMTAVTNMYNYTTISIVTKPELTLLRLFLRKVVDNGIKVVVTDASLPPMSMKTLLHLEEWNEVDLGDPRDTNGLSLIVPDSKNIAVSALEKSDKLIADVVAFVEEVVKKHLAENVIVVLPNSRKAYTRVVEIIGKRHPDVEITYFRSEKTIGVSNDRRVMVTVCRPMPPENSFDWLATHYSKETGEDISTVSTMLRIHSTRQAFYQTIGRIKDPSASTPSVVYTHGINVKMVKRLIGDYDSPIVLDKTHKRSDFRLMIGAHWSRTAELIPMSVPIVLGMIEKKGRMGIGRVRRLFRKEEHFKFFMSSLSTLGFMYDEESQTISVCK